MNGRSSSPFRGYTALEEFLSRVKALADWYQASRPEVRVITIQRRDFDLIKRCPEAAKILGISINDNGVPFWRGFELRAEPPPPP